MTIAIWRDRGRSAGRKPGFGRVFRTLLTAAVLALGFAPSPASAWWNDAWALRKKITLDTSQTGAAVNDTIGGVPVLVRLHAGNFRFNEAKADGSDLIFVAGDDKTPLKHHIEKFDPLLGEALVWVRVPDLKPGDRTDIWLYYKNEEAQAAGDAKGTFDAGTLLAYHFAERGTPAQDSSAWANHAQSTGQPADGAIIGTGLKLDGTAPLTLPASPSLGLAAAGDLTWSAWVRPAGLQRNAAIYSRRDGANGLIVGMDDGAPFVEIITNGASQRSTAGAPVAPGGWHHIAVTASPGLVTLYLNGAVYGTLNASLPALQTAALIGADQAPPPPAAAPVADPAAAAPAPDAGATAPAAPADPAAAPVDPAAAPAAPPVVASPMAAFTGELDELRIDKVARPAGYVRVAAIGEGADFGKLITVGGDEETASWISGDMAVILNSVTIDGWIVIAILLVMAVMSWIVMVRKNGYLSGARKANRNFKAWRDARDADGADPFDPGDLDPDRKGRGIARRSTLYRLHSIGVEQIGRRAAKAPNGRLTLLTPASLAAIRASLDTQLIEESNRLNSNMTILTISIAGGPYLGLLGTVVGVMIVFASIAASGDVNINSIAPGIAAALVATIAGLIVAIPALFAYNYFSGQIRDLNQEMHVFVDELVTRMGETFQGAPPSRPTAIAAE